MPEPATEGSSASPNQSLPAGTCLEEFIIDRVLGVGGFGITYLARDQSLGRQVVIKENLPSQFCWRDTHALTVRPRHTQGEDAENFQYSLESFRKEATTLASLDHPGIVKVLRSFQAHGTAYFVMPFVEGTALDEVIRQRKEKEREFTEKEIMDLLLKVLDALGYLHDRGIYHRDIKPGNILMTTAGPVLIDFGAARQRLSERSLTVIESAGYTPFEQLQSRGKVGPWSDIYALGGTLYKVITGETPAKANDRIMDDPQAPLARRMELRRRYSPRLLESIDQAMAPKAADRFQDTAQWRDGLGPNKAPTPPAHQPAVASPDLPISKFIYVGRKGRLLGSFTTKQILDGLASGQFLTTDLASPKGLGDWWPISELEVLNAAPAASWTDAPQPVRHLVRHLGAGCAVGGAEGASWTDAPQPLPKPNFKAHAAVTQVQVKSSTLPEWSLVFGIASWLMAQLTDLGIASWFCVICTAVPAVACGHKALGKIRRGDKAESGKRMAIAGLVMGYLFFGWTVIKVIIMVR
jgi:serine/threonine protein kinase